MPTHLNDGKFVDEDTLARMSPRDVYRRNLESLPFKERDLMIRNCLKVAQQIARRYSRRLPHWIQVDDLIQEAMLGMISVIDKKENSDPAFECLLAARARGAIRDFLRTSGDETRTQRRNQRQIDLARRDIERGLKRHAGEEDLARKIGPDYKKIASNLPLSRADNDTAAGNTLEILPCQAYCPARMYEERAKMEKLKTFIEKIENHDYRAMIKYHLLDGFDQGTIGSLVQKNQSTVSRRISDIVADVTAHFTTT